MAYEHEPLRGNRDPQLRYDAAPRQGGGAGPLLLAGALVVAVIGGIYAYSGPETPAGDAPVATQSPAGAPAATDPVATQPAAPADPAPAADPARDPSGAIPGVEPMVPTQPEPAPAAPAD